MNTLTRPTPPTGADTAITAIETVAFADLTLSDLNPRKVVSETGIEALAENIRALGLIQNLAGLRTEAGVEVVAGGRRLRALALLQDDPRFATVPVRMAPDADTARTWASTENAHREAMHPADEIRDYGAMSARGVTVPQIAMAFGATEKHVYRRLALAKLPDPVIDALRAGDISLGNAAAFTIADDTATILDVLEQVRGRGASDHVIKRMLRPGAVSDRDRRAMFVGVDAYREAGGPVGGDLFADEWLLSDTDLLDDLFAAKLAETAETIRTEQGWKWVETTTAAWLGYYDIEQMKCERVYPVAGDLTEEEAERYDELAELAENDMLDANGHDDLAALQDRMDGDYTAEQKALAGAVILVDRDGTVGIEGGLIRGDDRKAARAAGLLTSTAAPEKGPKDPISAKLRDDLTRTARAARQDALLDDPKLALHLLAYTLSGKSGYGQVFGLHTDPVETAPGTETGVTRDLRLAKIDAPSPHAWQRPEPQDFTAFRKRGDKRIMDLLHRHLCALLDARGDDLVVQIDRLTGMEVRRTWTPTAENFFGRVAGPYLVALWAELLDKPENHPTVTTFAKLKKGEKAARLEDLFANPETRSAYDLTEAQEARIAAWTPEGMA